MVTKKLGAIAMLLSMFLLIPFMTPMAHAQSATGSATITATCGIALSTTTLNFGSLARDAQSGVDAVQVDFTNSGSVDADVTVNGKNWKDGGGVLHIAGEKTKFATTDQGTSGAGVAYATKNALNATDGDVTFGVVKTGGFTNSTFWQLEATLQNLPFSGALTQAITFTGTCLV